MLRVQQLPTHFLPGALPSSGQGWFLGSSSRSPLCPGPCTAVPQASSCHCLSWHSWGNPILPPLALCPQGSCPLPRVRCPPGGDGGFEVEFQWNYCISCWAMIFVKNQDALQQLALVLRLLMLITDWWNFIVDAFIAWGCGEIGVFSVCKGCLEGEVSVVAVHKLLALEGLCSWGSGSLHYCLSQASLYSRFFLLLCWDPLETIGLVWDEFPQWWTALL